MLSPYSARRIPILRGRKTRFLNVTIVALLWTAFLAATFICSPDALAMGEGRKVADSEERMQQKIERRWREDPRNLRAEQYVLDTFGPPKSSRHEAGFPDSKVFFYVVPLPDEGLEELHWIEIKEGVVNHYFLIEPDPDNKIGGILLLGAAL